MANIWEPTKEEQAAWAAWVAERPPAVRAVAERFFPWKLYRLGSSGHRVTLYSFEEPDDGSAPTLKVDVTGEYNAIAFDRRVFGVAPEDLEECPLPLSFEVLGAVLKPEEVPDVLDAIRDLEECAGQVGGIIRGVTN